MGLSYCGMFLVLIEVTTDLLRMLHEREREDVFLSSITIMPKVRGVL